MTFEGNDPRKRLSVRAEESLHEAVERFAENHGLSKSEAVRKAIWDYVPDDDTDGPSDPELRDTYRWIVEHTRDGRGVKAKLAKSNLAQKYQMDKELVTRLRLRPLYRQGWIDAKCGVLYPKQPSSRQNNDPTHTND